MNQPSNMPLVHGPIVITGASGWLGKSFLETLLELKIVNSSRDIFCLGRKSGKITTSSGQEFEVLEKLPSSVTTIGYFAPFAFATQEQLDRFGTSSYVEINKGLIKRDVEIVKQFGPTKILLPSSGVVSKPKSFYEQKPSFGIYRDLKIQQEADIQQVMNGQQSLSILRLYSLSSKFQTDAKKYALANLVCSALSNTKIVIQSKGPVFRKYVSSEDLFRAVLCDSRFGTQIIESSGILIEIQALAELIVKVLASDSQIQLRDSKQVDPSDDYYSTDTSMDNLFREFNIKISTLEAQILDTASNFSDKA